MDTLGSRSLGLRIKVLPAAMATGKRRTASYRPVLERLAKEDPNDSVKVAAIYALRRLGVEPGEPVVFVQLSGEIRLLSPEAAAERLRRL